ncbi:kinase [Blastopirellula marina]|uniref:Kinase n=1 Tax=Blastopirellula marina TaxID=124 RepID=A0A2S8G9S1_9BACT|nr:kinase [Blastopirellula marina]PQO41169.1 kinase [Blastopirellula marina]PTL46045.1 kinase [Blastopirellula marina]
MEAILFIGLPASGKSSFYKERFFNTHLRISLDLLKTRNRERQILNACLATDQRVVIDNTSPTRQQRGTLIEAIRAARVRYQIVGYYFQSQVNDCLRRNLERAERVPDVAIYSAAKQLELPTWEEGFDQLFYVRMHEGKFVVEEWRDEI